MDVWIDSDRRFEVQLASDAVHDGMRLELTDLDATGEGPVLEAFWHDNRTGFDFLAHRSSLLPFAVVERFVHEARRLLPPGDLVE